MIRMSVIARVSLGMALTATLSFNSFAHTDETALQQLKRHAYPSISIGGGLACRAVFAGDNAISKFCDHLVLSGTFAAGDEVSEVLVENDLIESKRDAHTFTAIPTLALGYALGDPSKDTLAKTTVASSINQVGKSYKEYAMEKSSKRPIVAKAAGAAVALGTLALANAGRNPTSFLEKASVSASFTFTYVLKEAAVELMKDATAHLPELKVAGLFSAIGAVGMAVTTPFQVPYFIATALLEAGTFTALDEGIKAGPSVGFFDPSAKYVAALTGALLYIPALQAKTATQRIVSNIGQAFFLPAAFSLTFDTVKKLANPPSNQK